MEDRIREFDGVTYKDLFLSSIDVVYIRRLDIVQKPGSHASLYLEAVLDGEQEENELQNISKTMTLMYRTEGETRPLFYGVDCMLKQRHRMMWTTPPERYSQSFLTRASPITRQRPYGSRT